MKEFCKAVAGLALFSAAACGQPPEEDAPAPAAAESAAPEAAPAPERAAAADDDAFRNPPEWAKHAVWYQIFVERFHNGDPTNDPRPEDIEGTYPDFVPEDWAITPWTQDWYAPDAYFAAGEGRTDASGYPITTFDQMLGLRRYGGDLQGVMDKLDYLEELGVTAVYFNPLNDAPSLHKFDARHWRHIDRNFGPSPERDLELMAAETPDDPSTWVMTGADELFVELIAALRERNIRVILDYSWNHTGHRFWAWEDLLENQAASDYADWYWVQKFDDPETDENEFAYRGWFGVHSLPEIKETQYVDHAEKIEPFEGDIASEAVKQHIFAVTRRWLDPNGDGDPSDGVDGFRLDVAAEVPFGFWREYRRFVRDINPDAYLLGEVWWEQWPDKLLDPAPFLEGDVFDAVMNYRWYRAARRFFAEAPEPVSVSDFVAELESLSEGIRPETDYAMMNMAASHDTPRILTSLFNKTMYKVNAKADQDPNYKIHRPDAATFQTLRLLLAHQFTYVGAPQIWAGDEMGMWGSDDPHTRKPLIWPEFDFEDEAGHPTGLERPVDAVRFDTELFDYYKRLIAIRKGHAALRAGDFEFLIVDDEKEILAYRRSDGAEEIIAVFNMSDAPQTVSLSAESDGSFRDVLFDAPLDQTGREIAIDLAPRTAAVLASAE